MKNVNSIKRFWLIFGIILLPILVTAFAGCNFFPVENKEDKTEPAESVGKEFTRHEYLALLKTQDNHKVSVEELQTIVNKALNKKPESRSVAAIGNSITRVKKVPLVGENRFVSASAGRSIAATEEEPVEVYEFTVGSPGGSDEGFVLASNDVRVGHILAIAEGSLDNTGDEFVEFLQACIEDYITATIIEYESITEADIEAAVDAFEDASGETVRSTGSTNNPGIIDGEDGWESVQHITDFSIVKDTMLQTRWSQGTTGTYGGYVYNNMVQYLHGLQQSTGCGITAMAQIIAYHNYISPPSNIARPPAFTNHPNLGTWSGTFNLSQIRTLEEIDSSSSATARGQVEMLMFVLGLPGIANATYYSDGDTGVTMSNARSAFKKLGYAASNVMTATTITGTQNSFNITENTSAIAIQRALCNFGPVYISGWTQNKSAGHAWVIDGYATMSFYREKFQKGDVVVYRNYSLNNCAMVHCNFGWDGDSDGWYIYGLFDADRPFSALGRSVQNGGKNYSTDTKMFLPYK